MIGKRIAILIPCYNASATIGATLKSVEVSIEKLGFPVPVFIYDDCSKDDSIAVARNSWKNQDTLFIEKNDENSGERKTVNRAFEFFYQKYNWVFIIHADDIVKPDWLLEIYAQIGKVDDKEYFTIWSSFDSLDDKTGNITTGDNIGNIHARERTEAEKKHYLIKFYSNWHLSGAALNVSLFQSLGGFDPSMPQFGDTDFFVRGLLKGYRDLYLSRTLTYYRIISGSVSSTSARTNRDIKEVKYIAKKFQYLMKKKELKMLYRNLAFLSFKRSWQWFRKARMRNFFFCFSTTWHSYINSL